MASIDLRSDTVTRPSPDMRRAIADARVGDDVFDDDPTVHALQERVASLVGMESALFVPSGTMGNQLALGMHTSPGDQIVLERGSHIYNYEGGAPAALSGLWPTLLDGDDGVVPWSLIESHLHVDDVHLPTPSLICLENTHNRAGGAVLPLESVDEVGDAAHIRGLKLHLDGARLWNAVVASGVEPARWCRAVDSVSVCFSKGLGAPVGSVLAGTRGDIHRARRMRKRLGGGMRQVGILAAACLYALDHNLQRLADDHANAQLLAEGLHHDALRAVGRPDTNIVLVDVDPAFTPAQVLDALAERGVLAVAFGLHRIRMVTHLDVSREECERALEILNGLAL